MPVEKFGVGQAVRRIEDQRFLRGTGKYLDDKSLPGQLHAVMVRAAVPAGKLLSLDCTEAKAFPDVRAVYTGADLVARGTPGVPMLTDLNNQDGSKVVEPHRPVLVPVGETVRFVGDSIAMVVANSLNAARDAADLIIADYAQANFAVTIEQAASNGAPVIHDAHPGNVFFDWAAGDATKTDAALADAAHRITVPLVNNRVIPNSLEPRAALAYPEDDGVYGFTGSIMNVFMYRRFLAKCCGLDLEKVHVYADDIGGGFGAKNQVQPEHILCLLAAIDLDAPVKWMGTRSDSLLTEIHARAVNSDVELGFDANHKLVAMKVDSMADMGAYASTNGPLIPTIATAVVLGGAYDVQNVSLRVRGLFTNTAPTDAYRGAGRPEATYLIERALDIAAAELKVDPIELRAKNLIRDEQIPYRTAMGKVIDSGTFPAVLDAAIKGADFGGFPARRAASEAQGKLRGLGVGFYMECTLGMPNEYAKIALDAAGRARLTIGTQNAGMGHETSFRQLIAEQLGIAPEMIDYQHADTGAMPHGGGHGGSRSLQLGGSATHLAAEKLYERLRQLASDLLEADIEDIERIGTDYSVVGTDQTVTLTRLIEKAGGSLEQTHEYSRENNTFPNGAHCCELELDPDTGVVELKDYVVVDDFGRIINPMIVTGQVMGGIVQGLGQAWREHVVYDPDSGQLLSGSLMDYCLPRADDMIGAVISFNETAPATTNPLGVKGCGEAGAIASTPAFVNAVMDALKPYGVTNLDMPLTPEKLWRAMQ